MSIGDGRYLLDTHAFLWMAGAPEKLGAAARECIEATASELFLSVASVWEMAIKKSLGRLDLPSELPDFLAEQLAATRTSLLEVRSEHALRVETLPWHHRDPFDRLLVAQASFEKLTLLSQDEALDDYESRRVW